MWNEIAGIVLIPGGFMGLCYLHDKWIGKQQAKHTARREARRRHPAGSKL